MRLIFTWINFRRCRFRHISLGFIFADGENLIILSGLIFMIAKNVFFLSSVIIAGKNIF